MQLVVKNKVFCNSLSKNKVFVTLLVIQLSNQCFPPRVFSHHVEWITRLKMLQKIFLKDFQIISEWVSNQIRQCERSRKSSEEEEDGAATSCGPFSIHASASRRRSKQVLLLLLSPFSLSPARRTQRWMVPVSLDPGKRTLSYLSFFLSFQVTIFQYPHGYVCRSQEHLSFSASVIWHGPLAFLNAIALSSSFQMSYQASSLSRKYPVNIRPVQDIFEKYLDTDTFKILSEKSI